MYREADQLKGWKLVLSNICIIPQRYVMAIMMLLAVANAYTMRVCLNLAITQMVIRHPNVEGSGHYDPDACPDMSNRSIFPFYAELREENHKFDWDEATQGLILASFYYGYVITHIPGGVLAERYGGKWVLGLGLLSTAICTVITPVVTKDGGAVALFILRVIEGLGEGPTMPGLMAIATQWAPKAERGRFGSIVFGGAQIGNILGSYISGLMLMKYPWDYVFYLFGSFGFLWFIVWCLICYSNPNVHPFISNKEKKFLNENVDALKMTAQMKGFRRDPPPWKALLRSIPLWSLVIAAVGHDWGYFAMVTDLPKYMTDVLKFNIKNAGLLSAAPYMAMWISAFVFGSVCDYCIRKEIHSIKNARKIYTTIAATGPGICIIMASYSGCNTTLAVYWFIAAMGLMGAYYCGMKINALDIAPNNAGVCTSLVNGIAAISAIIVPYLIGLLTPQSTLMQWRIAFWVCLAVLVITNIIYIIFAEGEQQWWDDVRKSGYPKNWAHGALQLTDTHQKVPLPPTQLPVKKNTA